MSRFRIFFLISLVAALTRVGSAQDVRGSISGRVTDASAGVVVGAKVTVTNVATGVAIKTSTNESGLYQVLFLTPGRYVVAVDMAAFRKTHSQELELRVEDRLKQDIVLETASMSEEVSVVAEQPILETSTATSGQIVDSKTIEEMPLADGTAYFLARLAPGVEFTADPKFTRPMDNVNLAGVSASGFVRSTAAGENYAASSTEFSLDGAPNMISQNRLGFSPPSSAVQEFKVTTALYDAQYGAGGGGSVSLALKSGTNRIMGEVSYFNRDESRSANNFWSNRLEMPKEARDYHRATFMLSGPVKKNKTFFMVSGEYLFDDAPEPLTTTVPTLLMREGNFSETNVIMYDPATSRRVPNSTNTGQVTVRDPFPGNIIPKDRFHPVAQSVLPFFPVPNVPRELWGADLTRNYYTDRNRPYKYDGGVARIDHVVDDNNRVFLNLFRNWRSEDRSNWSQTELSQILTFRTNTGGILGWTRTFSPTTVLDVRVNAHRFGDWGTPSTELRAADLGFNSTYVGFTRDHDNIPRFDFDQLQDFGRNASDVPFSTYGILPILTKIAGRHSLKMGYEGRVTRESSVDLDDQAGVLTLRNNTTGAGSTNPGSGLFRDFSSFLVGVPGGGNFSNNTTRANQVFYHGAFVQDDWRVSSKLTLNLGVRWEMEGGMTERENRNTRSFDFQTANPVQAEAQARFAADFAANPAQFEVAPGKYLITPSQFQVMGGYLFADENHRDLWSAPKLNFLPRASVVYQLLDKLVLRTGAGMYRIPYKLSGIDQRGFSRGTGWTVSDPVTTLPRLNVLEDPLMGGSLLEPLGRDLGLLASLGGSTGVIVPYERENQYRYVFQVGVQYELPWKVLLETNYVASRGRNLIVGRQLNALPAEYLIDSLVRDQTKETFLTNDVPNPFRGIEIFRGDDHFNNTIDREKLLGGYPQFESIRKQEHAGSNRYDSVQLRVEKRMRGFTFSANYTYARLLETVTRLNDSDPELTERVATGERPHSYKLSTVVELPFGRGRKWMSDAPGWLDAIAGGWRVSMNYLWQAGAPLSWDNRYYDPNLNVLDLKSVYGKNAQGQRYGVDVPAWDLTGFYFGELGPNGKATATQIADDRIRTTSARGDDWTPRYKRRFPQTLDNVRQPPFHNLDIGLAKTFTLRKDVRLQIRMEAINAENYAQLSGLNNDPTSSSFGLFNAQNNLPRDIQVGARLTF